MYGIYLHLLTGTGSIETDPICLFHQSGRVFVMLRFSEYYTIAVTACVWFLQVPYTSRLGGISVVLCDFSQYILNFFGSDLNE